MRAQALHIIGVSLDLGGNRRGVDMGPSAFRIAGLAERLATLGVTVVDEGDLVAPIPEIKSFGDPKKKYIREIARVCERLYKTSLGALEKGGFPLVLGGDHSLAAGSVAATAEFVRREGKPLGLIWVDAHGDMNTPASSGSGNVHGMPLAALLGCRACGALAHRRLLAEGRARAHRPHRHPQPRRAREGDRARLGRPRLHDEGHRSLRHRVGRRAGADDRRHRDRGRARVVRSGRLRSVDRPGVGTPVKGGLDYREAHMLMEMVADSGLLRALDLVEVNPILDDRNTTAVLGAELALSALGQKII